VASRAKVRGRSTADVRSSGSGTVPRPTNVAVIGAGYVGLTTAACLAHLGYSVCCGESDPDKVEQSRRSWRTGLPSSSGKDSTPDG
jgi:glycine/D-amino acid oxidase-like deaminating enzyme